MTYAAHWATSEGTGSLHDLRSSLAHFSKVIKLATIAGGEDRRPNPLKGV